MQRCCARIAGLSGIACRSHFGKRGPFSTISRRPFPLATASLGQQQARSGQDDGTLDQSNAPRGIQPDDDYATVVEEALNPAESGDSYATASSRQTWIRREKAFSEGGFAYIDPAKLPTKADVKKATKTWMPFVEAALPGRLRTKGARRPKMPVEGLYSPQDISVLLHTAAYRDDVDLLKTLALDQDRWKAAVWLVTQAVEHSFKADAPTPRENSTWSGQRLTLDTLTADADGIALDLAHDGDHARLRPRPSLDQLTNELHPHHEPLDRILRHETLGYIWQSLGQMIISDALRASHDKAHQAIKPEILEIIAMLHHSGAMPSSIYSYQPADDSSALRQPPTLHLLSSQIITSLTDAAWRAHESLVVEEAKEKGGVYKSLGPEIPGSMYKVHVAALGHEVWLELVLWSCLYGRFFAQGSAILRQLARQEHDNAWSALSWRELATPIIQSGQEKSINWDQVKYIFNTGVSYADHAINQNKVRRTISAEIVAAFVDALVSHIRSGVGARGITPEHIARFLPEMKSFLHRNNMSLGFTSWDAIILRFMDSQGIDIDKDPLLARRVMRLSTQFGDEISTVNAPTRNELWQPTPAYVLDGTAAPIGHIHRVLRAHIRLGSFRAAMQVFEGLQKVTDQNKERAIQDFFEKQQHLALAEDSSDDKPIHFESRYSGIQYPSFFPQIPIPILADFLDLVVDNKALDFGAWLLHSEDIDGPIIPESSYGDAIMGPPLVRFAAAREDKDLMFKVFQRQRDQGNGDIPKRTLTALLQHQIEEQNWDFVERALQKFSELPGYTITMDTIAIVIRMILREAKTCNNDFALLEQSDTAKVFRKMIHLPAMNKRVPEGKKIVRPSRFSELSARIWRLLALVNDDWRDYAWKIFPHMHGRSAFRFVTRPFNVILEGVLDAYGSEAGKRYLGAFWPTALEDLDSQAVKADGAPGGIRRMPSDRSDTPALTSPFSVENKYGTHSVRIPGPEDRRAIVKVDLRSKPNIATIHLVLNAALREHESSDELRRQDAEWARQMMRRLGVTERYIRLELEGLIDFGKEAEVRMRHEDEEIRDALEDDLLANDSSDAPDGEDGDDFKL